MSNNGNNNLEAHDLENSLNISTSQQYDDLSLSFILVLWPRCRKIVKKLKLKKEAYSSIDLVKIENQYKVIDTFFSYFFIV